MYFFIVKKEKMRIFARQIKVGIKKMAKKFLTLFVAIMFGVTLFAQQKIENCPFKGRENCTGYCGRFTDENKDGYCDYSKLTDSKNLQADKEKDAKAKAEKKHHHKHLKKDSIQNLQQPTTQDVSCDKLAGKKAEHKCCKEGKKTCNKDKKVEDK